MTLEQQLQKLQHDLIRTNERVADANEDLIEAHENLAKVLELEDYSSRSARIAKAILHRATADGIRAQKDVNDSVQAMNRFSVENMLS